jgi:peptide/nickel transport system permease protein
MIIVALGVSTLCFLAVEFAPGDRALEVAMARYGLDGATPSAVEYVRTSEGLNRPSLVRYWNWLSSFLRGNWGSSLVGGEDIFPLLIRTFQRTALLAGAALCLSLLIALPLGIYCGYRPGSLLDLCSSVLSSLLVSFPSFVTGAFIVLLLAVRLSLFPVAGFTSLSHVVLPALTLAVGLSAASSRVVASSVLQARQSGHYEFARHKGLTGRALFLPHCLLNACAPIVTYVGLQAAGLLDGVVVIETLFAWPGLGSLLLEALRSGDILVIQGAGFFLGWIYVTVNTLSEWAADSLSSFSKERVGSP